jgi:hemoglobin-like flavoprotein
MSHNCPISFVLQNCFSAFYEILFRTHPQVKKLFEDKGMQVQARALMQMMNVLVKSIDDTSKLTPLLKKLGTPLHISSQQSPNYHHITSHHINRLILSHSHSQFNLHFFLLLSIKQN